MSCTHVWYPNEVSPCPYCERDELRAKLGELKACVLRYFEAVESGDGYAEDETYELQQMVVPLPGDGRRST